MAGKSLRDRLIESSSRDEAQDSVKHFAKFVLFWEEISEAFREGWSYKEIWRVLSRDGQIDFSYSSFLSFARKMKRRQIDCDKEKNRKAGNDAKAAAAVKAISQGTAVKPGATKVDLPLFGQEGKPRDPKRF